MANGTYAPDPVFLGLDNNGDPVNGGKLFTYESGTTTKATTWSDIGMASANTNPVLTDSSGRATVVLLPGSSYKFVFAPAADTDPPVSPYWTRDLISSVPPGSTSADVDVTGTAGATIAAGEACYLSDGAGGTTVGRWYLCDADQTYSSSAAQAVGFATAAIATGAAGTIRRVGRITGLTGLTSGTLYYVSATAGALTSSAPTNARAILHADSTTTGIILPGAPDASATLSGYVNVGTQTIAGAKTWSGVQTFSAAAVFSALATGIGPPVYARATADLTKNANTTLANITGLTFSIGANETWLFFFVVKGTSSGTADWKYAVTGPAAPTAVIMGLVGGGVGSGGGGISAVAAFGGDLLAAAGNAEEMHIIAGHVRNGANAGAVQAQMAQQTSDATNTVVRTESFVIAFRLA